MKPLHSLEQRELNQHPATPVFVQWIHNSSLKAPHESHRWAHPTLKMPPTKCRCENISIASNSTLRYRVYLFSIMQFSRKTIINVRYIFCVFIFISVNSKLSWTLIDSFWVSVNVVDLPRNRFGLFLLLTKWAVMFSNMCIPEIPVQGLVFHQNIGGML